MTAEVFTWDGYKFWISELAKAKKIYFCRGHANETWKLQTSFHRAVGETGFTLSQYFDSVVPEIHYHICAVRSEIIDLQKEEELGAFLALIQHHGFPTPLLDWTLSPYIAAYFAFKEVSDELPLSNHVKIYIFDCFEWLKSFQQILTVRDTSVRHVSALRAYAKFNPRIVPQQGVFTLTNVDDMEGYIVERENEIKKKFLYTALLSVKEKPLILRELNMMGINEMTLFPGVDGICRAMRAQFFSADTVGPTITEFIDMMNKKKAEEALALKATGETANGVELK